ncbi:ABC transporter substrate-binding protein [Pararhodobacter aggregans]|uniref:Iron ABC transporter substrate-binding protein n=1 Tax=Pararhodobacter aggregans TaxID=404875 RepID=A0A2T7UUZ4_9RHOB|nr:ABC transporter substrate-binding protein [Pararhodobacter aggregans]PTX03929.1 putative spermidine/putrescine transport system substrate-binding protein [Pararhodobacter aggregans]PVE48595.1 iron ABC transporter substrate-binding protein [Pararhodobacter aggregans]
MKTTTVRVASASIAAMLSAAPALAQDMAALVEGARAEGMLTTIALPHDWCGYGDVIAGFREMYPFLEINELNPDAGSADELEAIRANMNNTGPQAPDVIDVGLAFGPAAQAEGLITPYMVSTWDTIPEGARDAEGHWYGDYYGVMSFIVNTDLVDNIPTSFEDLLKPEYVGQVALAGDPRASNQAILAVMAAGMARGAEPGAAAAQAGLEFFAELNASGNFVPVIGRTGTLAQGTTPILIQWDYNALSARDTLAGNPPVEVVVPSDAVLAGVYVQAISAYAPHPNAARLWMEYLYSDEGQLGWLAGYCHPIRFNDLAARGVIPQDMMDALPPAESYAAAVFPTLDQVNANRDAVVAGWDSVVGANVE